MEVFKEYVIWSNEHSAWWAHNRMGYARDIAAAGLYTKAEAMEIVANATMGQWRGPAPVHELPVRIKDLPVEAQNVLMS